MEQRSLRLGDLVEDYCPRERRVTDHVIVALVGESVRQTRCAACETEHEYKEARVPKKKLKDVDASDLAGGVLVMPKPAASNGQASAESASAAANAASADPVPDPNAPPPSTEESATDSETMPDGWLAHRPLIRATLPRTENDVPPPRPIPEFTMHQRPGRGFGGGGRGFRQGFTGHGGGGGGQVPPGRDGNGSDGNRAPGPGGKSRNRRRHRRPR